jgi:PleD family two-component response regulator
MEAVEALFSPLPESRDAAKQAARLLEPEHHDRPASTGILIVDDSETNRMLLSLMMQELGYATTEAADGKEAIRSFDPVSRPPEKANALPAE